MVQQSNDITRLRVEMDPLGFRSCYILHDLVPRTPLGSYFAALPLRKTTGAPLYAFINRFLLLEPKTKKAAMRECRLEFILRLAGNLKKKIYGTEKLNPNLQLIVVFLPVGLRKTVLRGLVQFPRCLFVRARIVRGRVPLTACSSLALSSCDFHWKTQTWTTSRGRCP